MDSTLIFVIILGLIIYTLYWTYFNDFGLFLFIILLLLTGLFITQYISEKVIYYENKIKDIINEQIKNINNIKSNIMNEQMQNLKNIKSSIFN
jgi:hypothetical protein